jgi:predicted HD phosphohydrolase
MSSPSSASGLSGASVFSVKIQGGLMNAEKRHNLELNRFHQEAVRLRRWDDRAGVAKLTEEHL